MPISARSSCSHPRIERCLYVGDLWYLVCAQCGASTPDGPRDSSVGTHGLRITDRMLAEME